MTIALPVALTTVAACALINFWLAMRIVKIRMSQGIVHGDGGDSRMAARMRAHANFAEYTPIVLILIALIELAMGTSLWLWLAGGTYVVARILHPIGMDGWLPERQVGTIGTFTAMLLLAVAGLAVPWMTSAESRTVVIEQPR
ncbi:MAPEG family protein [Sphingomonas sp. BGYR3]|uniref:MAPEG family protein n=1 Tax=Sphingomonas sp. BGYR3 TaxID=2975483 RepID=UPI0021A94F0D|nr:MAPEG family protein [Sphingomonas sp. BGYR3]MDG5488682.1 MAPEG family protein [Sphingomonas sp. BGYR3]